MHLVCPNCHAEYEAPRGMVPDGGRHVQCSACHTRWFASNNSAARLAEEKIIERLEARSPHLKVVHGQGSVSEAETSDGDDASAPPRSARGQGTWRTSTGHWDDGRSAEAATIAQNPEPATKPAPEPEKAETTPQPVAPEKPGPETKTEYTAGPNRVDPADLEKFMSQVVETPPKPVRKKLEPDPSQVMGTGPNKPKAKPETPVAEPDPASVQAEPVKVAPAVIKQAGAEAQPATAKPGNREPAANERKTEDRPRAKHGKKDHDRPTTRTDRPKRRKAARTRNANVPGIMQEWPDESENRFMRGFLAPVAVVAFLLLLYLLAGPVSPDVPVIGPILSGYAEVVDGFRHAMAVIFPSEG